MKSIYDFSELFDLVVRSAPEQVEQEVKSIDKLLSDSGIEKGSILELACGNCAHGVSLAKLGYSIYGIDNAPQMLKSAQQNADAANVKLELVEGDIIDFNINTQLFDAAIFMSETFPLITEYNDIAGHFRSVRKHIKDGGLYIIDIDRQDKIRTSDNGEWGRRTIELKGGRAEVWHQDMPGDWVAATNHVVLRSKIHINNVVYETSDDWKVKYYSPWHLEVLIKSMPRWKLEGFYSWKGLSRDISGEEHYFMVLRAVK